MQRSPSAAQTSPPGWLKSNDAGDVGYIHRRCAFPSWTRQLLVGPCNLRSPGVGCGMWHPRDTHGTWHSPAGHRDPAEQLYYQLKPRSVRHGQEVSSPCAAPLNISHWPGIWCWSQSAFLLNYIMSLGAAVLRTSIVVAGAEIGTAWVWGPGVGEDCQGLRL